MYVIVCVQVCVVCVADMVCMQLCVCKYVLCVCAHACTKHNTGMQVLEVRQYCLNVCVPM